MKIFNFKLSRYDVFQTYFKREKDNIDLSDKETKEKYEELEKKYNSLSTRLDIDVGFLYFFYFGTYFSFFSYMFNYNSLLSYLGEILGKVFGIFGATLFFLGIAFFNIRKEIVYQEFTLWNIEFSKLKRKKNHS
jgi:hypothetical protein